MQPDFLVELHDTLAGNANAGAQIAVLRIGIGHERVKPVITALQFDQQEDTAHRALLT